MSYFQLYIEGAGFTAANYVCTAIELNDLFSSMEARGRFPSITSIESIARPIECLKLGNYFQVGWEILDAKNPSDTGNALDNFLNRENHVQVEILGRDNIKDFISKFKR